MALEASRKECIKIVQQKMAYRTQTRCTHKTLVMLIVPTASMRSTRETAGFRSYHRATSSQPSPPVAATLTVAGSAPSESAILAGPPAPQTVSSSAGYHYHRPREPERVRFAEVWRND